MYAYQTPLREMRFVIENVLGAPAQWSALPAFADLDTGTAAEVLDQAGRCAANGIERSMGILCSATCAMRYVNATGWLVGEPQRGLPAMSLLMNRSRSCPEAA